jgi:uncharacterized MAPEG superfamily protein
VEAFAPYGHALLSVALYGLVAQVLNALTGIRKGAENRAPGETIKADYANPSYRLDRTYMNAIEMMVFYVGLVFAAILAGASPFWVNLLASLGVVLRLAVTFVYLRGIGPGYGGLRTGLVIAASVCNLGLFILVLLAVF